MEETPLEAIPSFAQGKRKINRRFIYLVLGVAALALIFFSFKILGGKNKGEISNNAAVMDLTATPTQTPAPSPTSTPTQTPTPSPTSNPIDSTTGLDRSKLSVIVENGSGEAGIAGKAEVTLQNLGYDVISTGNADNFNYSNVTIQVKAFDSDYLALLQKDLGFDYTIGSASADLSDGFSSDALVIIGK